MWDEDLTPSGPSALTESRPTPPSIPQPPPRRTTDTTIVPVTRSPAVSEDTPLLHKSISLTFAEPRIPPVNNGTPTPADGPPTAVIRRTSYASIHSAGRHRGSNASRVSKAAEVGKSTFGQTVRVIYAGRVLCIGLPTNCQAFQRDCRVAWYWHVV